MHGDTEATTPVDQALYKELLSVTKLALSLRTPLLVVIARDAA